MINNAHITVLQLSKAASLAFYVYKNLMRKHFQKSNWKKNEKTDEFFFTLTTACLKKQRERKEGSKEGRQVYRYALQYE